MWACEGFARNDAQSLQSCPTPANPCTVAHQNSLYLEFSRQKHWSGLPFPSPGDLPNTGIKHWSPIMQANSLQTEPPGNGKSLFSSSFIYVFIYLFIYYIVLVLPYTNMHPPRMYTYSPFQTPLPPPSQYHPSGSSQCTSPKLPVSCIKPGLEIHFLNLTFFFFFKWDRKSVV